MNGPLICYLTHCTEGLIPQQFALGLLISAAVVTTLVLVIRWLMPGDD